MKFSKWLNTDWRFSLNETEFNFILLDKLWNSFLFFENRFFSEKYLEYRADICDGVSLSLSSLCACVCKLLSLNKNTRRKQKTAICIGQPFCRHSIIHSLKWLWIEIHTGLIFATYIRLDVCVMCVWMGKYLKASFFSFQPSIVYGWITKWTLNTQKRPNSLNLKCILYSFTSFSFIVSLTILFQTYFTSPSCIISFCDDNNNGIHRKIDILFELDIIKMMDDSLKWITKSMIIVNVRSFIRSVIHSCIHSQLQWE